eukprot:TRINITY_DN66207_c0_g1_i1.p2 TRINITY_DN66207_c0_g1~~TRINITY_DN66207_c0_g1_i1.p2  ORF type:complete len:108 (+),score=23.87 TRINITY_DN66207_c0_g1_i1:46-324(+)
MTEIAIRCELKHGPSLEAAPTQSLQRAAGDRSPYTATEERYCGTAELKARLGERRDRLADMASTLLAMLIEADPTGRGGQMPDASLFDDIDF